MVQSGVVLPEHLDVFEPGVARRLDYAYSGPQAGRIAKMLFGGKIELGAVHTYLELFARYFIDLTPERRADRGGQRRPRRQSLHRTQHRGHADRRRGDRLQERRRHRPGERDRRQGSPRRHSRRPRAFRRRRRTSPSTSSRCSRAIRRHHRDANSDRDAGDQGHLRALWREAAQSWHRLQHRGDRAAAADLRRAARPQGQDRDALGAEPAPDPDPGDRVRLGRADPLLRLGSRHGRLHRARAPTFSSPVPTARCAPTAPSARPPGSTPATCSSARRCRSILHGQFSSTVTTSRIAGFGGAPNMGSRRAGPAPSERAVAARRARRPIPTAPPALRRGRKLVVQIGETFGEGNAPTFVEKLDALALAEKLKLDLAPVMIYADDVTHIVTEEGDRQSAALPRQGRARAGRFAASRAIRRSAAGATEKWWSACASAASSGGRRTSASIRSTPTAACSPRVRSRISSRWSGGLYEPPSQFRNW